jgi:hypothetical protein
MVEGDRVAVPRGPGVPATVRCAILRGLAVEPHERWLTAHVCCPPADSCCAPVSVRIAVGGGFTFPG